MTVPELSAAVGFPKGFKFKFDNEFTAYNALVDACDEIAQIVEQNVMNGELDWDECFENIIHFNWLYDSIVDLEYKEDYKIDYRVFCSHLQVDAIVGDGDSVILEVSYIEEV